MSNVRYADMVANNPTVFSVARKAGSRNVNARIFVSFYSTSQ